MEFIDDDFSKFMEVFAEDINAKIRGIGKESVNGGTENGSFYRFSSFTTSVPFIYTGNFIKQKDGSGKGFDGEVPLKDILSEDERNNPEGQL